MRKQIPTLPHRCRACGEHNPPKGHRCPEWQSDHAQHPFRQWSEFQIRQLIRHERRRASVSGAKKFAFLLAGILLSVSFAALAQFYNIFPPPGSTITQHGVLIGGASNTLKSTAVMPLDSFLQGQGTGADPTARTIINCSGGNSALTYNSSSHAFGCTNPIRGTVIAVDESRTTNVVSPDANLGISVVSGNWWVTCHFIVSLPATNGGFGSELTFLGPGNSLFRYLWVDQFTGTAPITDAQPMNTIETFPGHSGAATTVSVTFQGNVIIGGSGIIGVSWAQNTSNANATVLKAGSGCYALQLST